MSSDNVQEQVFEHCLKCRSIHYPGEPCPYCYHKAKDERDIKAALGQQNAQDHK